jgi:hypothetical protein
MPLATDARLNVLGLLRHFVGKATGQNDGQSPGLHDHKSLTCGIAQRLPEVRKAGFPSAWNVSKKRTLRIGAIIPGR